MEQTLVQEIKTKTASNVLFLSLRNFGIQGISLIGFFLLTLLLGTGEVGLFAIVAESVGILGYFSDVGLAAALIQQREEPNKEELRTTFFIQQTLVVISLIIVSIIYSGISHQKSYSSKEFWIFVSLCFSFLMASLKTIPSIQLERHLNFKLISTIDILENISFYFVAVLFAYLGFGAYSYAIATFFRSILGLILIYSKSSWPIGVYFSYESAKKLFKYGIPFQMNSFIAVAKDRLSNIFIAGIIGREAFGILSWAQKGPRIPLGLMDAIMKVTFPTFSRLQDEKEILRKSITKSIYFIAFFVFPALAGIALISSDVINIIPKYSKWLPAVYPLYFYAANAAIASVTTPITNAFNATGKITLTTKLMIMWTVLTWIFYPVLSRVYGYQGTAYATLIVGSSSIVVWYLAEKHFGVNVFNVVLSPLVGTILMISSAMTINFLPVPLIFSLILKIGISVLVYFIYSMIMAKEEVNWFLKQIKCIRSGLTI